MSDVIRQLMAALPDSMHDDDDSWIWCWDELSEQAQDLVKAARRAGSEALETTQETRRTETELWNHELRRLTRQPTKLPGSQFKLCTTCDGRERVEWTDGSYQICPDCGSGDA